MKRRSARAVNSLTVPIAIGAIGLMPAEKQSCRHHVQRLEILVDQSKHLLEIG